MFRLSRLPDCLYIEKIILGKQLKGIKRFRKFYLVVYVFMFFLVLSSQLRVIQKHCLKSTNQTRNLVCDKFLLTICSCNQGVSPRDIWKGKRKHEKSFLIFSFFEEEDEKVLNLILKCSDSFY